MRIPPRPAVPRLLGVAVLLLPLGIVPGCATPNRPAGASGTAQPTARPVVVLDPTPEQVPVLEQANTAIASQEYEAALELFRELLSENPTLVDAHMGVGRTYEAMGELDRAEPAYARAAALDLENFDAQFSHGRVLAAMQRYGDAARAFHRALVLRPDSLEANVGMAVAYLRQNQAQEALAFAQKAVELDPSDGEARVNLAVALDRLGRNAEAIKSYETALELIEPRPEVLASLINLYAAERRYVEAINTANELIRIAPSANAYERLGWAHFRMAAYDKSIAAYRQGVAADPNHWPSLNGVATNALNRWLQSGKADDAARLEARAAFQRSLQVHPDQPKVVGILTKYMP